jgi:hypothetical protein
MHHQNLRKDARLKEDESEYIRSPNGSNSGVGNLAMQVTIESTQMNWSGKSDCSESQSITTDYLGRAG